MAKLTIHPGTIPLLPHTDPAILETEALLSGNFRKKKSKGKGTLWYIVIDDRESLFSSRHGFPAAYRMWLGCCQNCMSFDALVVDERLIVIRFVTNQIIAWSAALSKQASILSKIVNIPIIENPDAEELELKKQIEQHNKSITSARGGTLDDHECHIISAANIPAAVNHLLLSFLQGFYLE